MVELVTLVQGAQPTGAEIAAAAKNANALLGAGLGLGLAVIGVGLAGDRLDRLAADPADAETHADHRQAEPQTGAEQRVGVLRRGGDLRAGRLRTLN